MAVEKCPECPPPGAPGWMTTFADLMSLLLTFFVLLLSFAQLEITKFKNMAGAFKDAFGVQRVQQVNPQSTGEVQVSREFNQQIVLVQLVDQVRVVLEDMIDNGDAEVIEDDAGFTVRIKDYVMFEPDSITPNQDFGPTLQEVANILMDVPRLVNVTAHTAPGMKDGEGHFPSPWSLGGGRAASIVQFLVTHGGVDPKKFLARSLGDQQPISPNDTELGRERNSRIEIFITQKPFRRDLAVRAAAKTTPEPAAEEEQPTRKKKRSRKRKTTQ